MSRGHSLGWQISESSLSSIRTICNINVGVFIFTFLCYVANIVLVLLDVTNDYTYNIIFVVIGFVIFGADLVQTWIMVLVYKRDGEGISMTKRNQLRRLMLLSGLLTVSQLLYTLAYWIEALRPAATLVAFIWLLVVAWPGMLDGYDKDDEVTAPRGSERVTPFNVAH
jgi:hypothetical protein